MSTNPAYADTPLPSGKTDARPATVSADRAVSAAEWNEVMQDIADLRVRNANANGRSILEFSNLDIRGGVVDADDAIALAFAALAEEGGKLTIPHGRYAISTPAILAGAVGVTIEGHGGGYPLGTILEWRGTTEASYNAAVPVPMAWLQSCSGCIIQGIGLLGPNGYRVAEGWRLTTQSGVTGISTRNRFVGVGAGGTVETCVRVGGNFGGIVGALDNNNDFHRFVDCHFANYGKRVFYLEDTQVFDIRMENVLMQSGGLLVSATGTMTAGSAVLTHGIANAGTKDVGDIWEVSGAGVAGAILRARILAVGSGQVTLDTAASTSVGPNATITYGAQTGIYNRFCSFSHLGGGCAQHIAEDYFIGIGQPAGCEIVGVNCEGSRRFIATGGPSGNRKPVVVRKVRWSGDGAIVATYNGSNGALGSDPFAISWVLAGGLSIEDSSIGDQDSSPPIKLLLGAAQDVAPWNQQNQFTFKDVVVASSFSWATLLQTNCPHILGKCTLTGSGTTDASGRDLLGEVPRRVPISGAAVHGAQAVSLGQGDTARVVIDDVTAFTLADLRLGQGTGVVLQVVHSGGPRVYTFTQAITWAGGAQPAGSVSGGEDWLEFRLSATGTIYGRALGMGYHT